MLVNLFPLATLFDENRCALHSIGYDGAIRLGR